MRTSMVIGEKAEIALGDKKDKVKQSLDIGGVDYKIVYDAVNNEGVKESVIHLRRLNVELHLYNDELVYFVAPNTTFTHLALMDDDAMKRITSLGERMNIIKKRLTEALELSEHGNLKIINLNGNSLKGVFSVSDVEGKLRVSINQDAKGNVYMNTVRLLTSSGAR